MSSYRFIQLDVFTQEPFAGNPLAVFPEAEGLTDEQMMKIAREMNLSETVFVLKPESNQQTAISNQPAADPQQTVLRAGCVSSHPRARFPLPAIRLWARGTRWRAKALCLFPKEEMAGRAFIMK